MERVSKLKVRELFRLIPVSTREAAEKVEFLAVFSIFLLMRKEKLYFEGKTHNTNYIQHKYIQ